jgi:hypothetical protein
MCTLPPTDETRQILEPLDVVGLKGGTKKRAAGDQKPKVQKEKEKEKFKLKDETDLAVSRFFYECEIPLMRADDIAFKRMIRAVATYGEGYVPPDRERLSDDPSRDSIIKLNAPEKLPGLLSWCASNVRREQEELVANSHRMGATLVSDGAKNVGKANSIGYVLSTDKGKACVAVTDAAKMGNKGAEFLAEDTARAIRKVGEHAVFLLIMDGPAICMQALLLIQRTFPRLLVMRSVVQGIDNVLFEIGRRFTQELLAPVHSMILHITNHAFLFGMFENVEGPKHLLQHSESRLSVEVLCARAFCKDRLAIQMMWNHPNTMQWINLQQATRMSLKDRHIRLAEEYVNKQDWWRLLEAFVALIESALPILRDGDLDSPNLFKLPQLLEQACQEIQEPLSLQGQELDTRGLMADGGVSVAGRTGDGSVQGAVLHFLRANRDMLVSDVALAAAMVYPPYVYQDHPYEPEGGRGAFNLVAQRYFSHDEDAHVLALTGFAMLRNKQREFGQNIAKKLAFSNVMAFYESLCIEADLKPLAEIAMKLLHAVGTIVASDRSLCDTMWGGRSMVFQEKLEQHSVVHMHYRLKTQREISSGQVAGFIPRPRSMAIDVRQHWLMQRRYDVCMCIHVCVCIQALFWGVRFFFRETESVCIRVGLLNIHYAS